MASLKTIMVNRMLNYLEQEGKRLVTEAIRTKKPKNRSYNELDAFGYLVYYNGVLKRWSISPNLSYGEAHEGWEKYGIPDATGEEWAEMFKTEFEPPKTGFSLVIFNAAFYARIQEEGGGRLKEQWPVISQISGSLKTIESKFKKYGATLKGYNITIN